jgi:hypothetical protein
MQVGDYIIQQRDKNDPNYMYIFKILQIQVDGYLHVKLQAIYNSSTPVSNKHYNMRKSIKHITTARIKPYHPTLEELFIFKSFKEQS